MSHWHSWFAEYNFKFNQCFFRLCLFQKLKNESTLTPEAHYPSDAPDIEEAIDCIEDVHSHHCGVSNAGLQNELTRAFVDLMLFIEFHNIFKPFFETLLR